MHSGKASRDQVLLQATVWEAGQYLSLFWRSVKPYDYAVFLRLPCESIPPWQRFHLAENLITAREFNVHVRPACTKYALQKSGGKLTVRAYYSDDKIHVTRTLCYPSRTCTK